MKTSKRTLNRTLGGLVASLALAVAVGPNPASAAGLLIADGGLGGLLEVKEHDVQVTLHNGIAVTKVTQVFHNTEKRQVEALYTFPVPKGASVANFSMWINGKEMVGEVLEKKRAREIYNSYKATRRDPGLLEQTDYRTFEMRIFPIGPRAEQRVELTYYQELDCDHDWATYVYPLATATHRDINARTTGRFSLEIDVKSAVPIAELESPSHAQAFALARHDEGYWQANLEATGGDLSRDVVLACHLARPKTGMDLLTSKREGEDGFFCLTLMTGQDVTQSATGMDYVFVLDVSGSMADEGKLALSKGSVNAFLGELGDGDRFEVMTFNVQPALAFGELRAADPTARQAATAYLSSQQARGGTVLQSALATAYKYGTGTRPLNVVILSDGLTEQQERQVLLNMIRQRPANTRVFCVGVGNDVNRPLLEQLAGDAGGLAAFISREDNFARQARLFREKLLRPVATDVQISIRGVDVSSVEPKVIPNLYHGAPVRIYGRYRGSGKAEITLQASIDGQALKQSTALEFPAVDLENPEINRLWATHRIDQLLKEADRAGSRSPVIDEIVRLGEDFSVVTEYTSFLVLENDAEYQRWKIERRNLSRVALDRQAQQQRRDRLEVIRNKAIADLGPRTPDSANNRPAVPLASSPVPNQPAAPSMATPSADRSPDRRGFDLDIGTGPIGPLGVGFILWLIHRRKRTAQP